MKTILMLAGGALVILGAIYSTRQSFRNTLGQHQPPYTLKILTNEAYQPRTPTPFSFSVVDTQEAPLRDFATVHEKIMHIIVVRKDLQEFQHVHPLYSTKSGLFTLPDLAFLSAGSYRIFADFTPADAPTDAHGNRTPVTFFHDINVGDATAYNPQPLGAARTTHNRDGYHITLTTNPATLIRTTEATLTFTITNSTKTPVNNLEPYLGALGHSVILHEEDLQFIHTHPYESNAPHQPGTIVFNAAFPQQGRYKIFMQFQHLGKVTTTDFIVEVAETTSSTPQNILHK